MKSDITIKKENFESLNAYIVCGSNVSKLYRTKNKYAYKDTLFKADEYDVSGLINGKVVYIKCKDYRSAKQLFLAIQ